MTNPDRMRLEEISFPECLRAAVFNLYIQIMLTGTRGGALLLQPRSRCSGWAALGEPPRVSRSGAFTFYTSRLHWQR